MKKDIPDTVTVGNVFRSRCMDETDYICICGEHIPVRFCETPLSVSCRACGFTYGVTNSFVTSIHALEKVVRK